MCVALAVQASCELKVSLSLQLKVLPLLGIPLLLTYSPVWPLPAGVTGGSRVLLSFVQSSLVKSFDP